jgi:hypothetical protein
MTFARFTRLITLVLVLSAGSAWNAAAQVSTVTTADIQRLQDNIFETQRDISQLRSRDASLASELQGHLDEARDEAIYLKVKLRKNEYIARSEYAGLRDRIDSIRNLALGEKAPAATTAPTATAPATSSTADASSSRPAAERSSTRSSDEVPVGTEFDVRLQSSISSKTAQVEDRFEATSQVDLKQDDKVLVPAGSVLRGIVSSVNKAGRIERKGSVTLAFDQITIRGRAYPIRATVTQALESEGVRGEAGKIGTGAGVGAIIGGILGGVKGALAGILIGGGGVVAATEGQDVDLPAGTVLRVRLDTPLALR